MAVVADAAPLVYGYVRLDEHDPVRAAGLRHEVAHFCTQEGLRLGAVFVDQGYDGSETARPGFTGALDAVALPACQALVIPDIDHLSPDDHQVRAVLLQLVKRTGANLRYIHEPPEQ